MSAQLAVERATGSIWSLWPLWRRFAGKSCGREVVGVFRVLTPPPERAYGWAVNGEYGPQRIVVLGTPPIDSPLAAVRLSFQRRENIHRDSL